MHLAEEEQLILIISHEIYAHHLCLKVHEVSDGCLHLILVTVDGMVAVQVFKAELLLGVPEIVACKVYFESIEEGFVRKEAQMLANLRSSYVVNFSCAVICPGSHMLVTEYCAGGTLWNAIHATNESSINWHQR